MISKHIQKSTGLNQRSIDQVLILFGEGATIPFIARYRKERTGGLDEVQLASIQSELQRLQKLEKRKESILATIEEQGKLTPALKQEILNCWDGVQLEDLYLPFKKSRKTKADTARENGLETLAKIISAQRSNDLYQEAKRFVRGKVSNPEVALEGARHIIAEWINENLSMRSAIRSMFERYALLESKVIPKKKEDAQKYTDYFSYSEALKRVPSHRLLAVYRGEEESLLRVKITIDEDRAIEKLERYYIKSRGDSAEQLFLSIKDALKRLILPSIENEFKKSAKEKADLEAIAVFSNNLKQLLLASPLGGKSLLAIDPGFRTGCKVVVLDEQGDLLQNDTIYPHPPQLKPDASAHIIQSLLSKYNIENIAIGNATAGRETYQFLQSINTEAELYMVNESGASIYSASEIAREEFPDHDITVRGAVSIGRRLMDPLAELVKIDPKSIGVGQYQHDVNQPLLRDNLQRVVESCVNAVGINLNTASKHVLQYVSGIGPTLAENIINHRNEIDGFSSRKELLEVPRMGKKAYEQAAGFLRIRESQSLLDNTAVHPEQYALVRRMLKEHRIPLDESIAKNDKLNSINLTTYVSHDVGLPTLQDILEELQKPGLDPRGKAKTVSFSSNIRSIDDLKSGMTLTGVINNLTKFGAFVDIGIKESGLIHISQITDRFIKDPAEVLSLNQEVQIRVLEIDTNRKRISLSMKNV
ncbi:MAG: hypothetical protein ACJA01_004545 [Saprospiraceae bacterium]|jgi:uncharacterized protein